MYTIKTNKISRKVIQKMVKMMYDPTIVSEQIKTLRKKHGLTQQQLADKCGISINSVKSYESGRRIPDNFNLQQLAHTLRVDPFYLLGETNFENYANRYDKEHPEEVKHTFYEVQLLESAEKLGLYTINSDDPEKESSDFINYIKQYNERMVSKMAKSKVNVVTNTTTNEIRENFETGEITIYAITEADVEKGFQQLIKRGIIEE